MKVKLTPRLMAVANMVDTNSKIADIGTDHAQLPIYLVQMGICKYAIASDIKKGPVSSALKNITKYGYTHSIRVCLADGLLGINDNEVDMVVIAGMGAETIIHIIENIPKGVFKMVIQPMTDVEKVRRQIHKMGWAISQEKLAQEGSKLYHILKIVKCKSNLWSDRDYVLSPLLKIDPLILLYLRKELRKVNSILNAMKDAKEVDEKRKYLSWLHFELKNEIAFIREKNYNKDGCKMIKVQDIMDKIEEFAPCYMAQDWDNVGLIIGDKNMQVKKVMLALDIDEKVANEAANLNVDMIITHHPFIFQSTKRITPDDTLGRTIFTLIQNNIAHYCAHTNLDSTKGGLNDYLVELYGLVDVKQLLDKNGEKEVGLARYGLLLEETTVEKLAKKVAKALKIKNIQIGGDPERIVKSVAICSGGGGGFIGQEIADVADVYITGDIKYSNAREAWDMGLSVIIVGHYDTEIAAVDIFKKYLQSFNYLEIIVSNENTNVFTNVEVD